MVIQTGQFCCIFSALLGQPEFAFTLQSCSTLFVDVYDPLERNEIMLRTVVYRHTHTSETNVNDEIGLEPFVGYTVKDYIEDQEEYEGRVLLSAAGMVHYFSDGKVEVLEQKLEQISPDVCDDATRAMLRGAASGPALHHWPLPTSLVA